MLKWFLDYFLARRAFIYVLEIIAQVLLVAFASFLPPRWLAFIDNEAGEAALNLEGLWEGRRRQRRPHSFLGPGAPFVLGPGLQPSGVQGEHLRRRLKGGPEVRPSSEFDTSPYPGSSYLHVARASVDIDYAVVQAAADLIGISKAWSEAALSGLGGAPGG